MDENNSIQLFEDRKIRTVWDEEQEEWYFSVVDVIAVLTDSSNPTDYLKKMRKRDEQLARYLGTNCPQVAMIGATGKNRKVLAATTEQLLRIIQSIPSPKAEPFKLWLAQVGRERIEETIDPEQAIDRALETYQKKGYDTDWIHQRLLSIRVRNELTAEWQERGVQQGKEYGKQKEWEERYNAKRKAKMEAAKAAIRAEDMEKGIFTTVSQLPRQEPRKATLPASAAV